LSRNVEKDDERGKTKIVFFYEDASDEEFSFATVGLSY
jgi:hypothetical protein